MRPRTGVSLGLIALLVLVAALAGGCARSSSQTNVVPVSSEESTETVTPLERGELRREALRAVDDAMDAWMSNDLDAMRGLFADEQYEYFVEQNDAYLDEGKVRIRSHEATWSDVVEMTADGNEVSVKYRYTDMSYFEDADGNKLSEPAGDETEMTIVLVRFHDRWVVARIIAGAERLQ
jgi:predicted lipid-binding transport protein (Tim44 family)